MYSANLIKEHAIQKGYPQTGDVLSRLGESATAAGFTPSAPDGSIASSNASLRSCVLYIPLLLLCSANKLKHCISITIR